MYCDNCGREMAETALQCPFCGTLADNNASYMYPGSYQVQQNNQGQQQAWGLPGMQSTPQIQGASTLPQEDFSSFGGPLPYQAGYRAVPPSSQPNTYNVVPQQTPGYMPGSFAPYYQQTQVTVVETSSNNASIIAEIILSMFGLFGVGWLLGGEVTTGVILLICSIFVYWPIMFLGTLFTFGLGLICLGPLAIGAVIINALLCNHFLKRRATQILTTRTVQQPQPMQPPFQRPQ